MSDNTKRFMFLLERVKVNDIEFIKEIEIEAGLSKWSSQDYLSEITRPDSLFYIIRKKNEPLGFILARLIMYKNCNYFENEIEIYNLGIKKEYRRKKIGTRLLNILVQIGKYKNVKKIKLEVRKSNSGALIFYTRNLFRIDGERKNFYTKPIEDAVLMTRFLNQQTAG